MINRIHMGFDDGGCRVKGQRDKFLKKNQLEHYELTNRQVDYLKLKRLLDIVLASVAMLVLLLPFLFICVLQKLSSVSEPILFTQKRIGKDEKCFYIYKFRSMKTNAPAYASTSEFHDAEAYISTLGKFLRKTSIDELPQIINVLKGDMSVIGPRPLIPQEKIVHDLRRQYGVYQIRPGITGWAQINGRDNVSDVEKAMLDREYVIHMCFAFDIKIFFNSVIKVVKRDGIKN